MSTYHDLVAALSYPKVARTSPNKTAATAAEFKDRLASLAAGDWLACSGITFSGEIGIKKTLAAYAKISMDSTCKFVGVNGQNAPALWIEQGCAFLQLVGFPITNANGGSGIVQYASHHIVFDECPISDTGGSGVLALPVGGDIHDCFYRLPITNIGLNHAYDPHAEKGSGLQCMIAGDSSQGVFRNNRVALYGHDCAYSGGSVLELGDNAAAYASHHNDVWIKSHAMHFKSLTQTGGNAVNAWGYAHDNRFHIIEADDLLGFAFSDDLRALAAGQGANYVEQGTAVNCVQNPRWAGQSPWQKSPAVAYGTVTPA